MKLAMYQLTSTITLVTKGRQDYLQRGTNRVLNRKNTNSLKEDRITVVNRLKKRERLTPDEFLQVYESIHQKGHSVKYLNP